MLPVLLISFCLKFYLFLRVRLSKRRKAGKIGNTKLTVKYREYNKTELKQQVFLSK
jgi:hypothetical protein